MPDPRNQSVVVQQDFVFAGCPWVAITMEYLADYFEPVAFAEFCSVVYVCRREIPSFGARFSSAPRTADDPDGARQSNGFAVIRETFSSVRRQFFSLPTATSRRPIMCWRGSATNRRPTMLCRPRSHWPARCARPPARAERQTVAGFGIVAWMRVLVTGGAGFIGANVAIGLARAIPTGRSSRWTTCADAAPS